MKKPIQLLFVTLILGGLLSITSCKKDINVIYNLADVELCLPALPFVLSNGTDITYEVPAADIQAIFSAAEATYSADKIKEMAAKGFKLSVSSGSLNLDGIGGAQVYIRTLGTSGDGTQIAYTPTIPAGATSVDFNFNGTDLKSYISNQSLEILLRVFNRDNCPATCVTLSKGTINFSVKK